MLKQILSLVLALLPILLRLFKPKKKASEVLSETPVIDSVQEAARAKADEKYETPDPKGPAS